MLGPVLATRRDKTNELGGAADNLMNIGYVSKVLQKEMSHGIS